MNLQPHLTTLASEMTMVLNCIEPDKRMQATKELTDDDVHGWLAAIIRRNGANKCSAGN